jgi:hypothetical protein
MKKLATIFGAFLIASVVLTSCGGGEPTACDCAELSMEALSEAVGSPPPQEVSTTEAIKNAPKIVANFFIILLIYNCLLC